MREVDQQFRALPLTALADASLQRAQDLGAEHADVRVERVRTALTRLRDGRLSATDDDLDSGIGVRVLVDGTAGFASSTVLSTASAARLAEQAVEIARVCRSLRTEPVALAGEPVYPQASWVSAYRVDPFQVPGADQVDLLAGWSARLSTARSVSHVDVTLSAVKEQKFYADSAGTDVTQQRVRVAPVITVVAVSDTGAMETMRSLAPPTGRGWEYLVGSAGAGGPGWDWEHELASLPDLVAEKLAAPGVQPGRYDLVIDPSNLWLTIHESVGHATELDRALGYEAGYAGTSFATVDRLGGLRYGSALMQVTGDRCTEHALATVGFDDEGVAAQSWDLVAQGVLVGYQVDRQMAHRQGMARSNGCAFADSAGHVAVQRMPNVSLQPEPTGPDTAGLIEAVEHGLYVVGDKSWSIDMQRYNFQFTGQRFYRISNGRIAGMVKDVAYQATTTDFWGSLVALGGPQTYRLGGAFNCGKAQPGQVAAVSHGCPSALFEQVRVLNTSHEAA